MSHAHAWISILTGSIALSAFALRKKLLAQQTHAALTSSSEDSVAESCIAADTEERARSPQKKARKTRSARHTPIPRKETEAVKVASRSLANQDLAKLSEPRQSEVDNLSRSPSPFSPTDEEIHDDNGSVQPAILSSFRPSKSNFRAKRNGVCQLRLDEGEVCL